jgi:hypothetical protein
MFVYHEREAELSEHIHYILDDHVLQYVVIDHVAYTRHEVSEVSKQ